MGFWNFGIKESVNLNTGELRYWGILRIGGLGIRGLGGLGNYFIGVFGY